MRIRVGSACHEDWGSMTPRGPGRHCDACERTVVDATRLTEKVALRVLRDATIEGRVCARVRLDARGTPVFAKEPPPWPIRAAIGVALAGALAACEADEPSAAEPSAAEASLVEEPVDAAAGDAEPDAEPTGGAALMLPMDTTGQAAVLSEPVASEPVASEPATSEAEGSDEITADTEPSEGDEAASEPTPDQRRRTRRKRERAAAAVTPPQQHTEYLGMMEW